VAAGDSAAYASLDRDIRLILEVYVKCKLPFTGPLSAEDDSQVDCCVIEEFHEKLF
jgi:hypothetical protein